MTDFAALAAPVEEALRATRARVLEASERLVELHGQHDDRGLLNPRGHRDLLDSFADLDALRTEVRAAWGLVGRAQRELDSAKAAVEAVREEVRLGDQTSAADRVGHRDRRAEEAVRHIDRRRT